MGSKLAENPVEIYKQKAEKAEQTSESTGYYEYEGEVFYHSEYLDKWYRYKDGWMSCDSPKVHFEIKHIKDNSGKTDYGKILLSNPIDWDGEDIKGSEVYQEDIVEYAKEKVGSE